MNKKTIAVLLMAAATVLTACGTDKKEPTKENFQAALKTFAEGKETRECVGSLKFPIEQNGNDSVTTVTTPSTGMGDITIGMSNYLSLTLAR